MQPKTIVTIVCLVLVLGWIRTIWQDCFGSLRAIPGPRLTRFTKLWYLYKVFRGQFHRENIEFHRKYGPVRSSSTQLVFHLRARQGCVWNQKQHFQVKLGRCSETPRSGNLHALRQSRQQTACRNQAQVPEHVQLVHVQKLREVRGSNGGILSTALGGTCKQCMWNKYWQRYGGHGQMDAVLCFRRHWQPHLL